MDSPKFIQNNPTDDTRFKTVCLQKYPEYFDETITLLNNQWPRSVTARLRSLEQGSVDCLPTSLILLEGQSKPRVVAHSKISPVPYKPTLCFVESVVVSPELRGQGLGRIIMNSTELYVQSLGINIVYLTTFDQQGFYSRLGYNLCDPIVVFGGSMKLNEKMGSTTCFGNSTTVLKYQQDSPPENQPIKSKPIVPNPRAPPPPPPPPQQVGKGNINIISAEKVTMRKILCNINNNGTAV